MLKICGKCAQNQGLPLEERKQIALSREKGKIYVCPECSKEHGFMILVST